MWNINICIYMRGCTSNVSVTSSCTRWPSSAGPSGTHGLNWPWYSAEWATCGPRCWWGRRTRQLPRRSPSSAWWASGGCVASPAGRTSPSFLRREWAGAHYQVSFFPRTLVMAKLQPLGAAHASETTATCWLGDGGLRLYIKNETENVIPSRTISSLPVLLLLELRFHQRAPLRLSLHATPHFVLLI